LRPGTMTSWLKLLGHKSHAIPLGTTLIAAENTGRTAALLELDPKYADVIVRRWQRLTGQTAVLDGTGQSFADLAGGRKAA
jgi:hypothetical protein